MTTAPHVEGLAAPGFEEVRAEFERNFAERGEIGAAVAAYWRGETVVDLWGRRRTPKGDVTWNKLDFYLTDDPREKALRDAGTGRWGDSQARGSADGKIASWADVPHGYSHFHAIVQRCTLDASAGLTAGPGRHETTRWTAEVRTETLASKELQTCVSRTTPPHGWCAPAWL
jgi:hypothetical protein